MLVISDSRWWTGAECRVRCLKFDLPVTSRSTTLWMATCLWRREAKLYRSEATAIALSCTSTSFTTTPSWRTSSSSSFSRRRSTAWQISSPVDRTLSATLSSRWVRRRTTEIVLTLRRPLLPYRLSHIKHLVPDRVKPSFVIFDIRALWRSALSVRVPGCQKLQMTA